MTNILKGILFAIGVLFMLAIFPFNFWKSIERVETQETSFIVNDSTLLNIETGDGRVDIVGIDGLDEIKVIAEIRTWGNSESQAQENLENVDLTMGKHDGEVRLIHRERDTNSIHRLESGGIGYGLEIGREDSVSFQIQVPVGIDLKIISDDGDVAIANVQGAIDYISDNGDITMDHFIGSVDVRTDDGDVHFSGELIGPNHEIVTNDGDVEILVSANSSLEIDVSVDDGEITSDFPLTLQGSRNFFKALLNDSQSTLSITVNDDGDVWLRELTD